MLTLNLASVSDEIKDALPNSPTEDAPRNPFAETQGSVPLHPMPVHGSHADAFSGHAHSQISPLTPPEHYDLQSYRQEYLRSHQAGIPPSAPSQYSQLNFSFDGSVPQLWDMDGAPASPPPLPDFNLFMSSQPPQPSQPPQRFISPVGHKAPPPPPIYTHSTEPPQHRSSVPTIATPVHRSAGYHHSIRHPQPYALRTPIPPSSSAYHETYRGHPSHSPQGYVPGSSPTNPSALPADYRASFCKSEDESLDDHECLRLRLLEEAYRQRPPPQTPGPGAYGGPIHHSPDQWVQGGQRCVVDFGLLWDVC